MPSKRTLDEGDTVYVGHCSLGNGEYGSLFQYKVDGRLMNIKNQQLRYISGETYSDNSFCFLSSLQQKSTTPSLNIGIRPYCYKIICSERSLTINIFDDYIVCPRSGGKIEVEGYTGYFLCPDYNLMCSGTVICNKIFDCVDKKSETKESSYIYDYEIKTSLNIERAETDVADNINNYELSENATCPINCNQCKENKKCIKCRNHFGFVGNFENETIMCLNESELLVGYYKLENGIYYKCMKNCDLCTNNKTCQRCNIFSQYINGECKKIIENCEQYENEYCSKCNQNYAFNQTDRNTCVNINYFSNNYYTFDDGISFYPCEKNITDCNSCKYNKNIFKVE